MDKQQKIKSCQLCNLDNYINLDNDLNEGKTLTIVRSGFDSLSINKDNKGWYISETGDVSLHMDINYCPSCGRKLCI